MNVEITDASRPLWERMVMQMPALAALCYFAWQYQSNSHEMDTLRMEMEKHRITELAETERKRAEQLAFLVKALEASNEVSDAQRRATEALVEAVQFEADSDRAEMERFMAFLEELVAARTGEKK